MGASSDAITKMSGHQYPTKGFQKLEPYDLKFCLISKPTSMQPLQYALADGSSGGKQNLSGGRGAYG
jgi:hypothetical protein